MRSSPLVRRPSTAVARLVVAPLVAAALSVAAPSDAATARDAALIPLRDGPPKLYTFRLDDPSSRDGGDPRTAAPRLSLLDAFRDAAVDVANGHRRDRASPWSRWQGQPWWPLAWTPATSPDPDADAPAPADLEALRATPLTWLDASGGSLDEILAPRQDASSFDHALSLPPGAWLGPAFTTPVFKTPGAIFASNGFDSLWSLPPSKPIPNWRCRRRPVHMARYGGESDAFLLVRCDGSAAQQAFDRLTLMAREPTAPRPGDLLPDEPDPDAVARGEWTMGVRLVHPRLLWVMQRIADAFPWRAVYVFSGYRHDPAYESGARPKPGTHHSMHSEARALDIFVTGVPNAALFQVCHKLDDVGCGFYPNNKFVHVDVRLPGSGHPVWIDVSAPGEPSRYVDAWPGVIDRGGMVWDARGASAQHGDANQPGAEASCTTRRVGP